MGSLSYVYPGFIKNIIKNNGNQTFTVKLYDPKGQQIEVGVSNLFVGTSGSLGASSGKSGQPTWSTVLERQSSSGFKRLETRRTLAVSVRNMQQLSSPVMAPVLLLLRKINSCRAATCRVGFTEERKTGGRRIH